MERANGLSAKVVCTVVNDSLQVKFPAEMKERKVKADVWLYFMADQKKDIKASLVTSTGQLAMPLTSLSKGMHDVKINWEVEGAEYYSEQKLFIQ
jgi:hypothetical protein